MKYIFGILLLVLLAGCDTFQVKDTKGVTYMLRNRAVAESLKGQVEKAKLSNASELMRLYSAACAENNGWVDALQFKVNAEKVFDVSETTYKEDMAAQAADKFIKEAGSSLSIEQAAVISRGAVTTKSIVAVADVVSGLNEIVNNIIEQNNKLVKEARERIYSSLEKAKWKE